MVALAATVAAQNIRLYILQTDESAEWADVAAVGNGRVLLLPDDPTPDDMSAAVITLVAEATTDS